jgi:hypothetical protein
VSAPTTGRVQQVREMSDRGLQVHVDLEIVIDARQKETIQLETLSSPPGRLGGALVASNHASFCVLLVLYLLGSHLLSTLQLQAVRIIIIPDSVVMCTSSV